MAYDFPASPTIGQVFQGWTYDGEKWLATATAPNTAVKRNYLINGAFQINQGGYISGTVLAAGAYGHYQWKAGSGGGDYFFAQSTGNTTITIVAGKSLIQPIEDVRVTGGGNYTLVWTGTAQARAGVNTLTPAGAYAASPLLITGQTDGTVMSVEFNAGTLGNVGLYEGSVALPFVVPDFASELALCQRYWARISLTSRFYSGGASVMAYRVGWLMRSTPTVVMFAAGASLNITGATLTALDNVNGVYNVTAAAAGDCYVSAQPATLNARL
jgi:hypothetical protein